MTDGGDSRRQPQGWRHSEESKAKNSAAHTGMKRPPRSEEYRAKQSVSQKGKALSEETKRKIAEATKGKKKPERSEKYKATMSAAKKGQGKGKPWSEARRLAHKGGI